MIELNLYTAMMCHYLDRSMRINEISTEFGCIPDRVDMHDGLSESITGSSIVINEPLTLGNLEIP